MTSDHPRVFISYSLTLALALLAGLLGLEAGLLGLEASAETIVGTDLEAAELVAGLPWTFEVAVESANAAGEADVLITRYRFQSTTPNTKTAPGDVYLRAKLTAREHDGARSAGAAFEELLDGADPDTGLSYAWDQILLSGVLIYHLHAECTFSEENFRRMAERLEGALRGRTTPVLRIATCRCGGGCREVPAAEVPPPAE